MMGAGRSDHKRVVFALLQRNPNMVTFHLKVNGKYQRRIDGVHQKYIQVLDLWWHICGILNQIQMFVRFLVRWRFYKQTPPVGMQKHPELTFDKSFSTCFVPKDKL